MRRALFDAQYVIDIGFLQTIWLVYWAPTKLAARTITDNPPDYIRTDTQTNTPVRVGTNLSCTYFYLPAAQWVIIVRQGNYNLIIDTRAFNDKVIESTQRSDL
ncbi:hypothetical protein ACOBV9_18590 (plasmid) [Pseudoalteromonas espejiana]